MLHALHPFPKPPLALTAQRQSRRQNPGTAGNARCPRLQLELIVVAELSNQARHVAWVWLDTMPPGGGSTFRWRAADP